LRVGKAIIKEIEDVQLAICERFNQSKIDFAFNRFVTPSSVTHNSGCPLENSVMPHQEIEYHRLTLLSASTRRI
jgi:hypothetical protein